MKGSFIILLLFWLLIFTGCNHNSVNSSSSTTDSISDSSIIKAAKENSVKEIKPALDTVNIVTEELTKYILGEKNDVVVSKIAEEDHFESTWPECQCPVNECSHCIEAEIDLLFHPSEGTYFKLKEVWKDMYRFSCVCPCGCKEVYYDKVTIIAIINKDGKVEIQHFMDI